MSIKYKGQTVANVGGGGGADGATFTPSVSEDGTLSWTNNGGLPNPEPVSIKGPAEVYSTEEIRIGTWIDGKPLYRIVCATTLNIETDNGTATVDLLDLNALQVDTIINLYGTIQSSAGTCGPINWPRASAFCSLTKSSGGILQCQQMIGTSYKNAKIIAIVEYTKTTDQPEVQA